MSSFLSLSLSRSLFLVEWVSARCIGDVRGFKGPKYLVIQWLGTEESY